MTTYPDYTVRTMTRDEINIAIDWAAKEGWNPGIDDAECFFRTDPEGFLIGQLNGEPVAAISAVTYGRSFCFLGFFIVREEFRGMGLGFHIWNAGLKRLEGRSIGLVGVVRSCRSGYKIGPLFAEKLFCALTSAVPEGSPVFLDLPETNHAALEMAGKHKMETVFETARMYKGKAPRLPLNRIFGVTSFELG